MWRLPSVGHCLILGAIKQSGRKLNGKVQNTVASKHLENKINAFRMHMKLKKFFFSTIGALLLITVSQSHGLRSSTIYICQLWKLWSVAHRHDGQLQLRFRFCSSFNTGEILTQHKSLKIYECRHAVVVYEGQTKPHQ